MTNAQGIQVDRVANRNHRGPPGRLVGLSSECAGIPAGQRASVPFRNSRAAQIARSIAYGIRVRALPAPARSLLRRRS